MGRQIQRRTQLPGKRIHLRARVHTKSDDRGWTSAVTRTHRFRRGRAYGSKLRWTADAGVPASSAAAIASSNSDASSRYESMVCTSVPAGYSRCKANAQTAQHHQTQPHAFGLAQQGLIALALDGAVAGQARKHLLCIGALGAAGRRFGGFDRRASRCRQRTIEARQSALFRPIPANGPEQQCERRLKHATAEGEQSRKRGTLRRGRRGCEHHQRHQTQDARSAAEELSATSKPAANAHPVATRMMRA